MTRLLAILLTLISIQGFSQVKEINEVDFKTLQLPKGNPYLNKGRFYNFRGHAPHIENSFNIIELDTITYTIHLTGKIYYEVIPCEDLLIDINVGEIISKDSSGFTMKFTHTFHTDKEGNYDFSFIINNTNTLLSFNEKETYIGLIYTKVSDIYEIGKLLK